MKIQKEDWLSPKISVRNSIIEGKGMFADSDIKISEKLVIWGGDYTDIAGAKRAKEEGKLVLQWDEDLYSYEDRGKEDGYFINHSCDPNMWMDDAFTLVARRDIQKGEELTADYAMWEADEGYVAKWVCRCNSWDCRGKITGKDWRDGKLQKKYKNHFSPLINKKIKNA